MHNNQYSNDQTLQSWFNSDNVAIFVTMWKSYHTGHITENYLFRFLTEQYLEDFLLHNRIWFSRADKFMDKMECVHVDDLAAERLDLEKIEKRRKRFLISCWHAADRESLALWDCYALNDISRRKVAIRFARQDLVYYIRDNDIKNSYRFSGYPDYLHGGIVYCNLITSDLKELSRARVRYPAFRKELAFKYENEYRFVIEQQREAVEPGYGYMLDETNRLKFRVIVNPLLESPEYIRIHKRIKELGFEKFIQFSALAKWLKPEIWAKRPDEQKENE